MGAFKLGKMTFGSLFKKPETVQYPFQKKPQPLGLKGHIVIDVEDCILCGMCDRSCSTDCIEVNKKQRYWQIDRYACVQCGYCVTVCPKKCLHMHPDYAAASTSRNPERVMIPEQENKSAKATTTAQAAQEAPAKAPEKASSSSVATTSKASASTPLTAEPQILEESVSHVEDEQLIRLLDLMDEKAAARAREALGA